MLHGFQEPDPRLAAIGAALAPYEWQNLTTEMLARRIVAAVDRHCVERELSRIPGVARSAHEVEPASRDDERVPVVAEALDACRWRSLMLAAVCNQAVVALESWQRRRDWLDVELAWLLG
jgi:hypothetical protein